MPYTCTSISRIQTELTLITEDNRAPFHYQPTLSRYQSTRAWRCRGVSGSLARGTRDLNSAAGRTQQLQHVPGFLPWMLFRRPPLLAQCVDLDMRLYYVAVHNLVYGCGNVPQTSAESSDTPPMHCAQLVQQSVDMSIQLPAGLQ